MLAPIYQYHRREPWSHRLSADPNLSSLTSPWIKDGIGFYAHLDQAPGLAPVFEYRASHPQRFLYSRDPNVGKGWTRGQPLFYADELHAPGTVPIYQYHADSQGWRYLYSSDADVQRDWTKDGIAFFAVASTIEWQASFNDIEFGERPARPFESSVLYSDNICNRLGAKPLNRKINQSVERTASHELTISTKFNFISKMTFKASIPLLNEAKAELTFGFEQGKSTKTTATEKRTFTITTDVEVPAGEATRVEFRADWANNLRLPFKLFIKMLATGHGRELTSMQAADIYLMQNHGADVRVTDGNPIIVVVDGESTSSDGIESSTVAFRICERCCTHPCKCVEPTPFNGKSRT